MKNFITFILTALIFAACSSPVSKERYLSDYAAFVEEIGQNKSIYTDKDWEKNDELYRKYSEDWFCKFKSELSNKDKIELAQYKIKYTYHRSISKSMLWLKEVVDSLDKEPLFSAIDSIADKINGFSASEIAK